MTTYTKFQPQKTIPPFQFVATLDGSQYNIQVTWNLFAQRWYINIYDQNAVLVLCRSLVGSPSGVPILQAFWQNGVVYVTTEAPHGYALESTVQVTITGLQPAAYNGTFFAFVTGPTTFTYRLAANPGTATVLGGQCFLENFNVNLVFGYFQTSTLTFRDATQTFIVSP